MGFFSSSTKVSRVPSPVSHGQVKDVGKQYQGLVQSELGKKPGFSASEKYQRERIITKGGAAALKGAKQRAESSIATKNLRGSIAEDTRATIEQGVQEAMLTALIAENTAQHFVEASDATRKIAYGAGFTWGGAQALGAGQVTKTTGSPSGFANVMSVAGAAGGLLTGIGAVK